MEDNTSNSGLIDIVRDLREIEADSNGLPIYEERQGDENIRLTSEGTDTPEKW